LSVVLFGDRADTVCVACLGNKSRECVVLSFRESDVTRLVTVVGTKNKDGSAHFRAPKAIKWFLSYSNSSMR